MIGILLSIYEIFAEDDIVEFVREEEKEKEEGI